MKGCKLASNGDLDTDIDENKECEVVYDGCRHHLFELPLLVFGIAFGDEFSTIPKALFGTVSFITLREGKNRLYHLDL